MNDKKTVICKNCGCNFEPDEDKVKWMEWGSYSEKITTCPECDKVVVIKQENAQGLFINFERKYYSYR